MDIALIQDDADLTDAFLISFTLLFLVRLDLLNISPASHVPLYLYFPPSNDMSMLLMFFFIDIFLY